MKEQLEKHPEREDEPLPVDVYNKLPKGDYKKWLNSQDCRHNQCPKCHGNGVDEKGMACIHMISCPCPRCSPFSL